jgi:peptide-methionine (R)-S-oxide reductase
MITWTDVLSYAENGSPSPDRRVEKSPDEWKKQLSAEQFAVARMKGTERPFSSEMCTLFTPGRYKCVCCGQLLFDASEKFESGSGWPSFTQPITENAIAYIMDSSHGMTRVETVCNVCDAHLGHVFPDGPPPTGLRYCMNALSLEKVAESEAV